MISVEIVQLSEGKSSVCAGGIISTLTELNFN